MSRIYYLYAPEKKVKLLCWLLSIVFSLLTAAVLADPPPPPVSITVLNCTANHNVYLRAYNIVNSNGDFGGYESSAVFSHLPNPINFANPARATVHCSSTQGCQVGIYTGDDLGFGNGIINISAASNGTYPGTPYTYMIRSVSGRANTIQIKQGMTQCDCVGPGGVATGLPCGIEPPRSPEPSGCC